MSATKKKPAAKSQPAPVVAAPSSPDAPVKRRRGRPRKHPLPDPSSLPPAPPSGQRRRGRPPTHLRAPAPPAVCYSDINAPEVQAKLRELVRLAKEQDHLTTDDINETVPNGSVTTDLLDEIITRLRNLEIPIVDSASEAERVRPRRAAVVEEEDHDEDEPESSGIDVLDDPVRMYLKQMGQVPLLTREQEIAISKRIEAADEGLWAVLQHVGFIAHEYLHLGEALMSGNERFDKLVLDRKIDNRDSYFRKLQQNCDQVREALTKTCDLYRATHEARASP